MNRKQIEPFESWAGPLGYVLAKVSAMPDENPYANSCTWKAYEAWCAAADLLEADGWVSVGERLPEHNEWVLIWWLKGGVDDDTGRPKPIACIGRYVHALQQWRPSGGNGDFNKEISHWRPLPTPPGGDHD